MVLSRYSRTQLNPLDPHGLPDLQPHGLPHGWGHGVAHLLVLLKRCAIELLSVREALTPSTLPQETSTCFWLERTLPCLPMGSGLEMVV